MKRIGFITDYWGESVVREALEIVRKNDNYQIETIDDFRNVESLTQAVWGLLNLVDVVISYIAKDSRNIYYNIGLAHGLGKSVVIIVDDLSSLPGDLMSQRVISIDSDRYSSEILAFRIKEAIDGANKKGRSNIGYRGPRDDIPHYPTSNSYTPVITDFRSLFSFKGTARRIRFERWLSDVARQVPGWDVVESERTHERNQGFDLVIWNSSEDRELNALGNPIPIELKSIRTMNSSMLSNLLNRARKSGLRSVVLATTGINDQRTRKMLSRIRKVEGINAIALDRDDLIQVVHPKDLLHLIKQKVRELLYTEEF